jgi:hypothetical protein
MPRSVNSVAKEQEEKNNEAMDTLVDVKRLDSS